MVAKYGFLDHTEKKNTYPIRNFALNNFIIRDRIIISDGVPNWQFSVSHHDIRQTSTIFVTSISLAITDLESIIESKTIQNEIPDRIGVLCAWSVSSYFVTMGWNPLKWGGGWSDSLVRIIMTVFENASVLNYKQREWLVKRINLAVC